ncbi:MAG: hypothetical protein Q4G03_10605 [Planctomycetia bacterium]|nr:hypothetical protein [Planctomycetia bacterium]
MKERVAKPSESEKPHVTAVAGAPVTQDANVGSNVSTELPADWSNDEILYIDAVEFAMKLQTTPCQSQEEKERALNAYVDMLEETVDATWEEPEETYVDDSEFEEKVPDVKRAAELSEDEESISAVMKNEEFEDLTDDDRQNARFWGFRNERP